MTIKEGINKHGVMFGSRMLNQSSNESDYDIAIPDSVFLEIRDEIKKLGNIKYIGSGSGYNRPLGNIDNIKFEYEGKTINLITYIDDDFIKFKKVVETLKVLRDSGLVDFSEKYVRNDFHQFLCSRARLYKDIFTLEQAPHPFYGHGG